jgi:hypothetical protein
MKIEEAKKMINYLLDNNLDLVTKGQNKISIGLEGAPGIGKTAIVKEIAEERGAKFVRVELSSMEEIGDLIGIPCKEFSMISPTEEEQWVIEKLVDEYLSLGWKLCPNCSPRMGYAIPSWVPTDPDQEVLLLLDDYTRATNLFMQAIMSLIQFGEYISWKLPEKTHLILTSNEDNGSMNVTSLDAAQSSRLLNFKLNFDYEQYGKWMDRCNLKSELINFMLFHPEIFEQSDRINARTYTMFANALSGFKNFDSTETLESIDLIARGCFGDETTIGSLFVAFVNNNLDKLMSAEEMLDGTWADTSKKIKENVTKDGMYRADIASVLTMRLINYIEMNEKDSKKADKAIKRIDEIIHHTEILLTEDLIFNLIRKLNGKFPGKCAKMLMDPKVRIKVLG